ncbi:hypothetical protein BKA62DRAFT_673558 [Auriculariales sp. MPI-PUGE-AT-0066]|nr:hypothetical protein BKA62DRAFT_673558 [Auriculariales sp. MPI-PUGE-AT-0066]
MSERLGSGVASGVTKMMLSWESELDTLSMCESSSAKVVVDYVVGRPCTGLDKVRNTVKDVPWGTEVFRGLGCNPEIVGLHPKGRRVQCAIEAHRARGRRAAKSNTDVNGEDPCTKSKSEDLGGARRPRAGVGYMSEHSESIGNNSEAIGKNRTGTENMGGGGTDVTPPEPYRACLQHHQVGTEVAGYTDLVYKKVRAEETM